jgi:catechol 2,3-dioxygenase-like lactoylglutathione lyase family enzyme
MYPLHHIGYWVEDLDRARRQWRAHLGVGPFETIEHVPFDSLAVMVDGASILDCSSDHTAAFAAWGAVVVDLDQVHTIDERLARAYEAIPGAVSHVSWVAPDLQRESARLVRRGCKLISTARSGAISVAWHDGGPLFPHPIEVHQHNDVIAGMHARLASLRSVPGADPMASEGSA